ncbi:hypothetical protein Dimus_011583 [Dionaea muscipula]
MGMGKQVQRVGSSVPSLEIEPSDADGRDENMLVYYCSKVTFYPRAGYFQLVTRTRVVRLWDLSQLRMGMGQQVQRAGSSVPSLEIEPSDASEGLRSSGS